MLPVPEFGGLTAEVTPDKPNKIAIRREDGWDHYRYSVRFAFEQRHLTLPFSTGTGWNRAPRPAEALTSYFDDAIAGREADGWEDYARTFGYEWEEDPALARRAKRSYEACLKVDGQLRALFAEHFEHAERVFTELERRPGYSMSTAYVMQRSHANAPDNSHDRVMWRMGTVLAGYYDGEQPGAGLDTPVRDLLTDLIHYCDTHGVDLDDELGRATSMARQESAEWHAS
jgi:hypothetical protein